MEENAREMREAIKRLKGWTEEVDVMKKIGRLKGWTKEADEVLGEIRKAAGSRMHLEVEEDMDSGCGHIELRLVSAGKVFYESFTYRCDKLRAFKEVLLKAYESTLHLAVGDVVEVEVGDGWEKCIVAQVGPFMVNLISLENGNRWDEAVKVDNIRALTKSEIARLIKRKWRFIGKAKEVLK